MNKVILLGRLTKDPVVRYSNGENPIAIARFTIAVDRRGPKNNQDAQADFINCVSFGKTAEFAEKYYRKGIKIALTGRIQTGSYEKDGQKVYTTEVVVEEQEFAESKSSNSNANNIGSAPDDGFMNIADGVDDEIPFN